MNILRTLTLQQLRKVLGCKCPSRIPRSGPDAAKVNCYTVYINKESNPFLLVDRLENDVFHGREWDGNRFSAQTSIHYDDVKESDLIVWHFYGNTDIEYKGFKEFLNGSLLKGKFLSVIKNNITNSLKQYIFNKKKIVGRQRHEILLVLLKIHLEDTSIGNPAYLMSEIYTNKWIYHPQKDKLNRELKLHLNSFIETGELTMNNNNYQITGKGLQSIDSYEEDERRHTENVIMQRLTLALTVSIAIFTAVQAEIIKIPTFIDFTKTIENASKISAACFI